MGERSDVVQKYLRNSPRLFDYRVTGAGGLDRFHVNNLEAIARQRLGESQSNHNRAIAPLRAHSDLNIQQALSQSMNNFRDQSQFNQDQLNASFHFGELRRVESIQRPRVNNVGQFNTYHVSHSTPASPAFGRPITHSMSGPLDAMATSSAPNDLDIFDFISPRAGRKLVGNAEEILHHSMPDLSSNWNPFQVHSSSALGAALHRSAPDLHYNDDDDDDDESLDDMDLLEPIPLDEMIVPRPPSPRKKGAGMQFNRAISMTLSPTSPSVEVLSKDLLAHLEKLNGSSIRDNNPFEPLPLQIDEDDDACEPEPLDAIERESYRYCPNVLEDLKPPFEEV
jgi:hypothetical protein